MLETTDQKRSASAMELQGEHIDAFARFSGDCNPLHVDASHAQRTFFGRRVAHGILCAIEAMRHVEHRGAGLGGLEIEFRHGVFAGDHLSVASDGETHCVRRDDETVLSLRAIDAADPSSPARTRAATQRDTVSHDGLSGIRSAPREWDLSELANHPVAQGTYPLRPVPAEFLHRSCLTELQVQLLALTSYAVGMELPGKHSLFTGLSIRFLQSCSDASEVTYRCNVRRFVPSLRILEFDLEVFDRAGEALAVAEVNCYVPFSPQAVDTRTISAWLSDQGNALSGKSALICGGSRGLGADLVAALALCGCRVFVASRSESIELEELRRNLEAQNASFTLLRGDLSESARCREMLERIRTEHGQLDFLVLNACAPPPILGIGEDTMQRQSDYISENLKLFQVPLAVFGEDVDAAGGAVVAISSTYVHTAPRGLSHYAALKRAVEGFTSASAEQFRHSTWLIARPPKLQTTWNDTPTGVAGAVPSCCVALGIVDRLLELPAPGNPVILEEFPSESEVRSTALSCNRPGFRVAVCGSFTLDTLVDSIRYWFDEAGLNAGIEVAGYGQVIQELVNPASILGRNPDGANLILIRVRDWLRERSETSKEPLDTRSYLLSIADEFARALVTHRQHASAPTVLLLCPSTLGLATPEDENIEEIELELVSRAARIPGLTVTRAVEFEAGYGASEESRYDRLRDDIAHIPYRDEYLDFLGAVSVRCMYREYLPLRKVIAVDCDNTLWRGVVGEDGSDGISFEPHHLALQRFLVKQSERGTVVCLCSKNIESDVLDVFENRSDMLLRPEHIVASMVNWNAKSKNLRELATRLNLGLDSFCFLDDNPVECAEVRAGCPEVLTLQWPRESRKAQALLAHLWEFDGHGGATAEDSKRTRMYREEYAREVVKEEALSFEEFIANLDLTIEVNDVTAETLARASQMTMRTNQFNFTTIRRSEGELQQLLDSPDFACRTLHVADRFGEYGIVGLLILDLGKEVAVVDTFLMSCRVLGRGVEQRMALEVGEIARSHGLEAVELRIQNTRKNLPARQFLQSICPPDRLVQTESGMHCSLTVAELLAVKFRPEVSPDTVDGPASNVIAAPVSGAPVRDREAQIERAAYELTISPRSFEKRRNGKQAIASTPEGAQSASSPEDIRTTVVGVFADVLRRSAGEIEQVDELEQLGCDSLKIVTITVALSDVFPWLPSTLLFEHARVSDIVDAIAGLRRDTPVTVAASATGDRSETERHDIEDLAVVGIGVRCAGADSPDALWRLLRDGASAVKPVPPERDYFLGRLEDNRQHWAGLLDGLDLFDEKFFSVSPREAQWLDPQLRLFMEVAWSALEDAGLTDRAGNRATGVFVGVMYDDYASVANRLASRTGNQMRSWEGFSIANRFSQFMGFDGPSLAIETACSSSATAVHQARLALLQRDCDAAVVGGVNLVIDPNRFVQLGRLGILSANGECRPFGETANGTVLGEGAGVVVLKRLSDAISSNDRIYGLIKGTGISTGAGSVGFTVPNPVSQAEAARRSLEAASVDPRSIAYIETHGTGTALGDPIEVRGLAMAYEDRRLWSQASSLNLNCALGSIKANVGHLEAGAGVLGLIKVLLQLYNEERVPSLTSEIPNPQIDFRDGAFSVQRQLEPWTAGDSADGPASLPRRAAVNSFGVGGANVHVIVEEAPRLETAPEPDREQRSHVFVLSADRTDALARQAETLRHHLGSGNPQRLGDIAYSINVCRSHLDSRVAFVADRPEQLSAALQAIEQGELAGMQQARTRHRDVRGRIAFLFTGQGSQYAGMGAALYDSEPVFRQAIDECSEHLRTALAMPIQDVLFVDADSRQGRRIDETRFTQPALFSLQYALAMLWRSWGVRPDVVIGHSIGEFAAACIAGGLTLADAASLVAARGRLMQALPSGGAMLAVSAEESIVVEAVAPFADQVSIAAVNAPGQIVISGAGESVAEIAEHLQSLAIEVTPLKVSHAFHSPLMEPMLKDFGDVADSVSHTTLHTPFVSTVDARARTVFDSDYWVDQIRRPVRFMETMQANSVRDVAEFIEIGPHPVLTAAGQRSIPDSDATWIASLRRGKDAADSLRLALGQHAVAGGTVDWRAMASQHGYRRVQLPAHAFGRESHWLKADSENSAVVDLHIRAQKKDPTGGCYRLAWQEAPAVEAVEVRPEQRYVVIGDSDLARELGEHLRSIGCTSAGLELPDTDEIPEKLDDVLSQDGNVNIVFVPRPDVDVEDAVDQVLMPLTATARVVSQAASTARLWIVTQSAVATEREKADIPFDLVQGATWGFGRVYALEQPSHWGGLVDVERPAAPDTAASDVVHQMLGESDEDQVAFRQGKRLVPRLQPQSLDSSTVRIDPEATYIVTGGTGALGKRCARWLFSQGAKHLTLVSRSGPQSAGMTEFMAELAESGANVDIISADLSQRAEVGRVVDLVGQSARPVRGIVHAAGVDETASVERVSLHGLKRAFGAKLLGAHWLGEAIEGVDFFALFSSMSSVLGSTQRSAYAAANAALDLLAHERRRTGLVGHSVDWGPWAGGGMASVEDLESYARAGNAGLDPDVAVEQLGRILAGGTPQVFVADIDWTRFAAIYEAQRPRRLISELVATSRSESDSSGNATDDLITAMGQSSGEERHRKITDTLLAMVRSTLEMDAASNVDVDQDLFELGLDSLLAVEFVTRVEKGFKIKDPSLIVENRTVGALADKLSGLLDDLSSDEQKPSTRGRPNRDNQREESRASGIETYRAELDDSIDAFQLEAWPERGARANSQWRWLVLDAASRLDTDPQMWMYVENDAIVGETAGIPVDLQVGRSRHRASWLVDSKVLEPYRSRAVGTRLVMRAAQDTPIALSLGQDPYMRKILLQMGWTQVTTLQHLVYPIRSAAVLSGKLGAVLARLGGPAIDAARSLRRRVVRPQAQRASTTVRVDRFGPKHDRLWERMAADSTCACVRDASFLNWKYVDRPGEHYAAIDIHCDDEHVGTAVLGFQNADEAYRYRRAHLLELIVAAESPPDAWAVLDAVIRVCHENDADAVHTHLSAGRIATELIRYGFVNRGGKRHLLVALGAHIEAETAAAIRNADSWWLTLSDSDMDGGVRTRPVAECQGE